MPTGIGETCLCRLDDVFYGTEALICFEFDAVFIGDQASGLNEPCGFQCIRRHQHAGPENETIGNAVGFGCDGCADFGVDVADLYGVTKLHAEPAQQQGIDGDAIGAIVRRGGGLQCRCTFECDCSVKRIGGIGCLDFNQCCRVGGHGHGAERGDFTDRSLVRDEGQLPVRRFAVDEGEFGIATQEGLALFIQATFY